MRMGIGVSIIHNQWTKTEGEKFFMALLFRRDVLRYIESNSKECEKYVLWG